MPKPPPSSPSGRRPLDTAAQLRPGVGDADRPGNTRRGARPKRSQNLVDNALSSRPLSVVSDGFEVTASTPVPAETMMRSTTGAESITFEDAYREHAGAVLGQAHRLLGDRARAEEVTQEIFLRLWGRPDRFDPARGSLRTFLLTDCHGRSIDVIRAETARRLRDERGRRGDDRRADTDIADDVCSADMHDRVGRLIQTLPEQEREVITLAYTTGVTYEQVAVMLELPEGTVKGRIRRGLRRLRFQMDDPSFTAGPGGGVPNRVPP